VSAHVRRKSCMCVRLCVCVYPWQHTSRRPRGRGPAAAGEQRRQRASSGGGGRRGEAATRAVGGGGGGGVRPHVRCVCSSGGRRSSGGERRPRRAAHAQLVCVHQRVASAAHACAQRPHGARATTLGPRARGHCGCGRRCNAPRAGARRGGVACCVSAAARAPPDRRRSLRQRAWQLGAVHVCCRRRAHLAPAAARCSAASRRVLRSMVRASSRVRSDAGACRPTGFRKGWREKVARCAAGEREGLAWPRRNARRALSTRRRCICAG
jgi:hypothetical protein